MNLRKKFSEFPPRIVDFCISFQFTVRGIKSTVKVSKVGRFKFISGTHFNILGGNSQNFLRKFVRFFLTLKCLYGVVIHKNMYFIIYTVVNITL